MSQVVFVSAFTDASLYARCILENPWIKAVDGIGTQGYDNSRENLPISVRFNQFLDHWDEAREAWFIFCHSDWEVLEDVNAKLEGLDKSVIWGPIGAKLLKQPDHWRQIHCGTIRERSRDGSVSRTVWNRHSETGTPVDTFDAQCLIVHSSLIRQHGLRFDEQFQFDLYVEDFCVMAEENHGIPSQILRIDCRHNSIVDSMDGRSPFFNMVHHFNQKWSKNGGAWGAVVMPLGKIQRPVKFIYPTIKDSRATIYKRPNLDALVGNPNDAMALAFEFVAPGTRVLDAGCAAGDLGSLLHDRKNCRVFGMDYNADSVELARSTGKFEGCRQINLDDFNVSDFGDVGTFDYIILGDVCEHLRNPTETLTKLKKLLAPGGAFCLSIPNVAHASVKAALLLNRWDYKDVGLMDRTHIHMFSWKGIARELADATLAIETVRPTFFGVQHMLNFNPFLHLSFMVRRGILNDVHSYVGQYVMLCRPSNAFDVEDTNRQKLDFKRHQFRREIEAHGEIDRGPLQKLVIAAKQKLYRWKFKRARSVTRQWKFSRKIVSNLDRLDA